MPSDTAAPSSSSEIKDREATPQRSAPPSAVTGYVVSLALVAAATVVAFVVDHIVQTPNLSLVFVLPVIVAALSFGWGPSLVSALLGVAVFDFLFVEPRLTFEVASPTDLWALGLLLLVAAIASTVGAQSRGRALASQRTAEQAEALHDLARTIIKAAPSQDLISTAARSLARMFRAPAVILAEKAGKLSPAAKSGAASLSPADLEAAQWALANGKPTRAETYPFDQARFDFWPSPAPANRRLVLGVKFTDSPDGRPEAPERLVDLVAGYLAAAPADGRSMSSVTNR
jgi:K+-sensing histidine kinase KdpD